MFDRGSATASSRSVAWRGRRWRFPAEGCRAREKGLPKPLTPGFAVPVATGEIRAREPTAHPKFFPVAGARLKKIEPAELDKLDPAGKGFGGAFGDLRRGAPEGQETGRIAGPVDEHAQHVEQRGHRLDFVQDDEPFQRSKHHFRVLEPLQVGLRSRSNKRRSSPAGTCAPEWSCRTAEAP